MEQATETPNMNGTGNAAPCGQVQRLVSKPLLLHGDCRKFLFDGTIEPDSIDLTVTSPPYDNLRTYNNSSSWGWPEFSAIAAGLWRVTKPGGVVVWVVNDATIKGSETGTSFEQALHFKKCGFNLHDTMIYQAHKPPLTHNRYEQAFEYSFVFSKGAPKTFVPLLIDCKYAGSFSDTRTFRHEGEETAKMHKVAPIKEKKIKGNVWSFNVGFMKSTTDRDAFKHPAIFPEQLAHDHILSWSNEGDTVFDPFLGSGTTGKMAKLLNRKFIGIEIDFEYYQIATKRIEAC